MVYQHQHQQQMSISLDAAAYAAVYSVLLLHNATSLPSLTLSGADWTFTRINRLTTAPEYNNDSHSLTGGPGEGELAASTASVVLAIRRCMVRHACAGNTL